MTSLLVLAACSAGMEQESAVDNVEFGKTPKFLLSDRPVPNQYIVVLEDPAPGAAAQDLEVQAKQLAHRYGGTIRFIYGSALRGFSVRMPEAQARALSREPSVKYVEQDGVVTVDASQSNPPWGLDRIDQTDLPLNQTYTYTPTGTGVNAYILDTGIRITHQDFGGRAFIGTDTIGDGQNGNDCHGHGTHVAGTVGGTIYGVAKNVKLYAVRVLNCQGSGTWDQVIAGVNWVTSNHVKPAVANMSLGGGKNQALNDAVTNSIAAGVTYAIAAGNSNADACNYSPASTPNAITVGATESTDARASYSNWGTCLDIFAPGSGILSAWSTSDTATNTISGTSMATPHVAGVAALYLQCNPSASPDTVANAIINNATPNKVTNPGTGSPNRLLYMGWITCAPGGDTTPPTTSITSPAAGSTVSGTVTVSASATDNVGVTRVDFYAGSALIGSDTTAPYSVSWNTLNSPNGTVSLTSRAMDAAGNVGVSSPVSVTVNNPGYAVYDSVLKAPRCSTVGNRCDTSGLVNGRANLGPEPNQPNTINNSCADGTAGTYHSDESIDRVRVYTVDGTNFAPGKQVRIEVLVWAWSGYTSDFLDLYYAANASSPTWQFIGTIVPSGPGAQTMTATYTLPVGSLQAVRAQFRYSGSASPCTAGSFNDRDDVIFAVQ